jgi:hypothetical protein
MNLRSVSPSIAVAVLVALGTGTAAQALPLGDRASVELFVGGNAGVPGAFNGGTTRLQDTSNGNIAYDRVGFDSAYDHRYTGGAELDYAFDSRLSGFARASYAQFDGRDREVGAFYGNGARMPITAQFEDDSTRALDVGARYMFAPEARFRPFVGVALGASDLSSSRAVVSNPSASAATRVELAKGGTVFEQRLETGVQFSPLPNFDLRLTAAASHLGGQKASDDPNLALLGIAPTHSTVGARWEYPAEVGAVWHF